MLWSQHHLPAEDIPGDIKTGNQPQPPILGLCQMKNKGKATLCGGMPMSTPKHKSFWDSPLVQKDTLDWTLLFHMPRFCPHTELELCLGARNEVTCVAANISFHFLFAWSICTGSIKGVNGGSGDTWWEVRLFSPIPLTAKTWGCLPQGCCCSLPIQMLLLWAKGTHRKCKWEGWDTVPLFPYFLDGCDSWTSLCKLGNLRLPTRLRQAQLIDYTLGLTVWSCAT